MLVFRVAEVVDVELLVPICHHGLVVIGPPVVASLGGMLTVGT